MQKPPMPMAWGQCIEASVPTATLQWYARQLLFSGLSSPAQSAIHDAVVPPRTDWNWLGQFVGMHSQ